MTMDELQAQVKGLGTIMGVWAHPDDEIFMSGGLMAVAAANGQSIVCVTATRGEKGVQDETKWPAAKLADIRTQELAAAYEVLGIKHHYWLDYTDGGCMDADQYEAVERICDIANQYQPDTIITFPPNGSTGHPDHVTVSRWACVVAERCKKRGVNVLFSVDLQEAYDAYWRQLDEQFNIYFNLDKPRLIPEAECDLLLQLTPELSMQKCEALCAMPSQTEAMVLATGKAELCRALATEGFTLSSRTDLTWT